MDIRKEFESFLEEVWPVIMDRFQLDEDAEPTEEEFQLWCDLNAKDLEEVA